MKRVLFSTLLLAGCSSLLWGYWIPAKAVVAQVLLQRAWEISLQSQKPVKPWPWADIWPIGRLQQPRLGVDLIVLQGASGEALAFGPGRIGDSGYSGGELHTILAGHRDTSFSFLEDLQRGDLLTIENLRGQDTYTVQNTEIVPAAELYLDGKRPETLSLITCYPFTSLLPQATSRYLVTAQKAAKSHF